MSRMCVLERPDRSTCDRGVLQRVAVDHSAVNECIVEFGGLIYSIVKRRFRNPADVEEVVQEIFLDLWKNAEHFDPARGSEMAFVAVISRRRVIDRLRKMIKHVPVFPIDELTNEPFVESKEQRCVEAREVVKEIRKLPVMQQKVLYLSVVVGMSHSEIALYTGWPLGTIKTAARRALMTSRDRLYGGKLNHFPKPTTFPVNEVLSLAQAA